MLTTPADADRVCRRLLLERSVYMNPDLFALDGREELEPDHEGYIIAEYGFDAMIRYYCPTDPRLPPLGLL